MSAERALLTAIRAAVSADEGAQALIGDPARFYDQRPKEPVFPFVTVERVETAPADASEAPALAHTITLHVWSREGGKAEALAALAALRGALHNAPLSVEERKLVLLSVLYTDVFLTTDARAMQGVMRLRAITEDE